MAATPQHVAKEAAIKPPLAMLAELTHRCPLQCPYCSNPLELIRRSEELDTEEWAEVFRQAAALGVLQAHLSGGEPTARKDLTDLVAAAHACGLYTNLITAAMFLTGMAANPLVSAAAGDVANVNFDFARSRVFKTTVCFWYTTLSSVQICNNYFGGVPHSRQANEKYH